MNSEIEQLLPWSAGVPLNTIRGKRLLRTAEPSQVFWSLWNTRRDWLVQNGVSVQRTKGIWQAVWWSPAPEVTPMPALAAPVASQVAELCRPYQVPAVGQLIKAIDQYGFAIDGSDMGTGKMYVGSAVAASTKLYPVVVCRKAAIPEWKKVTKYMGVTRDPVVTNYEQIKIGKDGVGSFIETKARNGRMVSRYEFTLPPDALLLFDEIHWCRGMSTDNAELVIAAKRQGIKTIGMSGTFASSPLHLRAIGYALGLHNLNDFYAWMINHGVTKGKFGGFDWNCGMDFKELYRYFGGEKHRIPSGWVELMSRRQNVLVAIHNQIFPVGRGVRIRKTEVPGFPENTIIPYRVDFGKSTGAIRYEYDKLRIKLSKAKGSERFTSMKECMMAVEKIKVMGIVEDVDSAIEEGNRVCVFVNFNESVDSLVRHYKTECYVRGGQHPDHRQSAIASFQSNTDNPIILNNAAGGESIGLHDLIGGYPRVGYVLPTFWAEPMIQCMWRTAREGAKTPSITKIPFAADTPEEDALINFQDSVDKLSALNDGVLQKHLN